MLSIISRYRSFCASLLAMWMSLIVISGIIFMHKEVTSNGEIITHIHPYDFTKNKAKHHHKSDAEIRYLDVVFQGSFTAANFYVFEVPVRTYFEMDSYQNDFISYTSPTVLYRFSRGPPPLV